jgi:rod shape-determining protein MreD
MNNANLRVSQPPEYLLLPAHRGFIFVSIVFAFLLNVMPWGQWVFVPDFLALVIVFWNISQPRKFGIGLAFLFGLLMDVHASALLGERALAYSLLSYGAIALHRRVQFFPSSGQMLHVLPLFLLTQLVMVLLSLLVGGVFPGFAVFIQAVTTTLLWPVAKLILTAPQRRAVDHDENRPI